MPIGDWGDIGMPFYTHTVVYRAELEGYELSGADRATLHLPGLMGTAEIRINGDSVDQILWPPHEIDITKYWTAEKLEIEIEIADSLTNLFSGTNPRLCKATRPEREHAGLLSPPIVVMTSRARKPDTQS